MLCTKSAWLLSVGNSNASERACKPAWAAARLGSAHPPRSHPLPPLPQFAQPMPLQAAALFQNPTPMDPTNTTTATGSVANGTNSTNSPVSHASVANASAASSLDSTNTYGMHFQHPPAVNISHLQHQVFLLQQDKQQRDTQMQALFQQMFALQQQTNEHIRSSHRTISQLMHQLTSTQKDYSKLSLSNIMML